MTTERKMTEEETALLLEAVKTEARRILANTLPNATKFWADKGLSARISGKDLLRVYTMGIGAAVITIVMENAPEKHPEPETEPKTTDDIFITVCDACEQASCWQGEFYCDEYKTADTKEMRIGDLKKLALESDHYWKRDPSYQDQLEELNKP